MLHSIIILKLADQAVTSLTTNFVCSQSSKLWLARSICLYVNMLSLLPIIDPFDDSL